MDAALARAVDHAKTREQFRRPIASFQAVQFRLAESFWRLSGLRLLVREAAWRADRGQPETEPISALAWLHARQVGRIVGRHVHQVFGAVGFTDELGLTRQTGAVTVLRLTVPVEDAVAAVRRNRLPVGEVPPSTVLGGLRRGS
jgi:alkylation response protein AidB-like acyl-CoA dehydrogenase